MSRGRTLTVSAVGGTTDLKSATGSASASGMTVFARAAENVNSNTAAKVVDGPSTTVPSGPVIYRAN